MAAGGGAGTGAPHHQQAAGVACGAPSCLAPSAPPAAACRCLQASRYTGVSLAWAAAPPPPGTRRPRPPRRRPTRPSSVGAAAKTALCCARLRPPAAAGLPCFGLLQRGMRTGHVHRAAKGTRALPGDAQAHPCSPPFLSTLPGMSGPYSRAKDPFLLYDLSQPSPVRDYARRYYNQAWLGRVARGGTGAVGRSRGRMAVHAALGHYPVLARALGMCDAALVPIFVTAPGRWGPTPLVTLCALVCPCVPGRRRATWRRGAATTE